MTRTRTTVTTESYSFGDLVRIEAGNRFKVIIHPEHQDAVANGGRFRDEQGIDWTVSVTDTGSRKFTSRGRRVTVKASAFKFIAPVEDFFQTRYDDECRARREATVW